MIDIQCIVNDFLKCKTFQEFINNRFNDSNKVVLDRRIFKIVGTESGLFYIDDMVYTIEEVANDYIFDDIRKTDIVLDIGACIGAFSLKIYKNVNQVYAVEPILNGRITKNIQLNNAQNVTVLNSSLGNGILNLNWQGYTKSILGSSLTDLIQMCGGHVDFLKCDCEGGEWAIKPEELKNIRRIEMEVHKCRGRHDFDDFLKILDLAGFKYTINIKYIRNINEELMLVHAKNQRIDYESNINNINNL